MGKYFDLLLKIELLGKVYELYFEGSSNNEGSENYIYYYSNSEDVIKHIEGADQFAVEKELHEWLVDQKLID